MVPEGKRFTEQGGLEQFLSVRGHAIPIDVGDAEKLDAEGNTAIATAAVNYASTHGTNLPANSLVRVVGSPQQYFFDGAQKLPVSDPTASSCLQVAYSQSISVITASWAAATPTGTPINCVIPDGTRFTETGSPQQYLAVRGATLPIFGGDAAAFDAEGNVSVAIDLAAGYVAGHPTVPPAGTLVRPVGLPNQYVFDGTKLLPVVNGNTSTCWQYVTGQPLVAVPTDWINSLSVGPSASCALPDGVRFVEGGSSSQRLTVRGSSLPITVGDAEKLDAEGNKTIVTMPTGYTASLSPTLPANLIVRPVGGSSTYLYDGTTLHPITSSATTQCLLTTYPNAGTVTVPADWASGVTVGNAASCSSSSTGTITGSVTTVAGPADRVQVRLYTVGRSSPSRTTLTDVGGGWSISAPAGTYQIELVPSTGRTRRAWLGGAMRMTSTTVVLTNGGAQAVGVVQLPTAT